MARPRESGTDNQRRQYYKIVVFGEGKTFVHKRRENGRQPDAQPRAI
jgi:hypothetical protein